MKVINLSYSDKFGGAARSAYNIHLSLKKINIDSKMIVLKKTSNNLDVIRYSNFFSPFSNRFKNYISIIISRIFFKGTNSFNFFSNNSLVEQVNSLKADIILIHWIHAEMLSIENIQKIKGTKIFVLHDMWWINGCEHYFNEKKNLYYKFKKKNSIKDYFNLSKLTLIRKKKIKIKNIVCPSNWILKCAKKSYLSDNSNLKQINYALDTNMFKPLKKIKENKKTIKLLFVGFGKIDEKRKGLDLLINVLKNIRHKKIELIIIGDINKKLFDQFNFKIKFISRINSDTKLNKIYNLSDILLFTSRQDNLPNVVMEAQSSGLPVVAFETGGLKDLIKENVNGYLCKNFNHFLFAKNVDKLINSNLLRKKFSKNSRKYILKNFKYEIVGNNYKSFLKKAIS